MSRSGQERQHGHGQWGRFFWRRVAPARSGQLGIRRGRFALAGSGKGLHLGPGTLAWVTLAAAMCALAIGVPAATQVERRERAC